MRDPFETPMCPSLGCTEATCAFGRHERIFNDPESGNWISRFWDIVTATRYGKDDNPLSFLAFAGIALMANAEQFPFDGTFTKCDACGGDGCLCDPNLLAILAEEGGSEWQ